MAANNLGEQLEDLGWLQGVLIPQELAAQVVKDPSTQCIDCSLEGEFLLVVVSQSCDIANNDTATVQCLVARIIEQPLPQYSYNAHPRLLDTFVTRPVEDSNGVFAAQELHLRVSILEKIFVKKDILLKASFIDQAQWGAQEQRSFRHWLGEHYSRTAFPTDFNNLIKHTKGAEKKLAKIQKQSNQNLYAIYTKISPFAELEPGQQYKMQLLGALTNDGDKATAEAQLQSYADQLRAAGIDVTHVVVREKNSISMAMLEGMERFPLDKLTHRIADSELPLEAHPGL